MRRSLLRSMGKVMGIGVIAVAAVPIVCTICEEVGSIVAVEGQSMQPCLNPHTNADTRDVIILNKWKVKSNYQFQRGEIVCLSSPKNPDHCLIKRVIGLDGDHMRTPGHSTDTIHVPEGHLWVEGDNRNNSLDSNFFGPLPKSLIYAKATHVIWPPHRIQTLPITPPPKDRFIHMSKTNRTSEVY